MVIYVYNFKKPILEANSGSQKNKLLASFKKLLLGLQEAASWNPGSQFGSHFLSQEAASQTGFSKMSFLESQGFMVGSCSDHSRIILGSWSDRPRIGNDVSSVFSQFLWDFGRSFFVAGAVFGDFGLWRMLLRALKITFHLCQGSIMSVTFRGRRSIWWVWTMTHVAPRIVNNVSFVSRINHEIYFSWQAQYLVSLDYDTCCSAHCK